MVDISLEGKLFPVQASYQRYYQMAMRTAWSGENFIDMPGGRFTEEISMRLKAEAKKISPVKTVVSDGHTSLYCYKNSHQKVLFAIDAADKPEIERPDLLDVVQLYFKANHWPQRDYPANVVPIVNGNGVLSGRRIKKLCSLRDQNKTHDLIFVSRVWGGIEHNVRCFETLKQLPGRNLLLAIFTPPSKASSSEYEMQKIDARNDLEEIGIRCTNKPISLQQLWRMTASSRVVFLRAGKHLCIPWRMLDLLAMGSVVVTDSVPYPEWPEPLVQDTHYCSLNIPRPVDTRAGPLQSYGLNSDLITSLIANPDRRAAISTAAIDYFSTYGCPEAVGSYIRKNIERVIQEQ